MNYYECPICKANIGDIDLGYSQIAIYHRNCDKTYIDIECPKCEATFTAKYYVNVEFDSFIHIKEKEVE